MVVCGGGGGSKAKRARERKRKKNRVEHEFCVNYVVVVEPAAAEL